jgi:diguanylate cyclase
MILESNPIKPFGDFQEASRAILAQLHELLGFDLWMVTRTSGEDWIVLSAEDRSYNVKPGQTFRWADSFCSLMVQGRGPRIAPSSDRVVEYATAPIGQLVKIGAYVGVPLTTGEGELFGTLCAIHPAPLPETIAAQLPLVETFARLLSSILQAQLEAERQTRAAERSLQEALLDPLTQLYNRRGWERLVHSEEERCRRYGHPASMISIDLDHLKKINDTQGHAAGDALITRAAQAIKQTIRPQDVAARLGGDEFAILATECDQHATRALFERLKQNFAAQQIDASLGVERCCAQFSFLESWSLADRAMYSDKSNHHAVKQLSLA